MSKRRERTDRPAHRTEPEPNPAPGASLATVPAWRGVLDAPAPYGGQVLATRARTATASSRCTLCGGVIRNGDRIATLVAGSSAHVGCIGRRQ